MHSKCFAEPIVLVVSLITKFSLFLISRALDFQNPMQENSSVAEDVYWMRRALQLARQAAAREEVPVGAILVARDEAGLFQSLGEGSNAPIGDCDPTAHAEIKALRAAANSTNNYRLPGSTLYVTIEPCTMCYGAMVHARVARLVYAAAEPRAGVIHSNLRLQETGIYNHQLEVVSGVLEQEAQELMHAFFKARRKK